MFQKQQAELEERTLATEVKLKAAELELKALRDRAVLTDNELKRAESFKKNVLLQLEKKSNACSLS